MAIDRMNKQKGGHGGLVVNTASAAGIIFGSENKEAAVANPYFVAKHAVVSLTRALSNPELEAETGVRVQCICPSFADTNIITDGMKDEDKIEKMKESIENMGGGLMKPEYVAEGFHSLITNCGNGAALFVGKDVPFFTYPDFNLRLLMILGMGAKVFGVRVFQWYHQIAWGIFLFILLSYFFRFFINLIL